jgi:hypothetical protein
MLPAVLECPELILLDCMQLVQQPNHISFPLLNMLTAVLAQVSC